MLTGSMSLVALNTGDSMPWTKEQIQSLLDSSDKAVVRAAFAIYHRQTPDEKETRDTKHSNGVGFSYHDAEPMSRFCDAVAKGAYISERWMGYARRTMKRYHRQLCEIADQKAPAGPRPVEPRIEPALAGQASKPCDCEYGDGEPNVPCSGACRPGDVASKWGTM
jgi:hypothetical protein